MSSSFQRLNLGITKCYLLASSDGYLLIDTAYPGQFDRFAVALRGLGVAMSEIGYLLLTHHHDDHAGFAARLVAETGCNVIVHKNAVAPLSRGESASSMEPVNHCIRAAFSLFSLVHAGFTYPPLALSHQDTVVAGDTPGLLDDIGIDGEILYTPGHSSDSISVVLSDGSAFVGDAAMNFLNFCRIRYRPIFAENWGQVFQSWSKLIDHGATMIYPAHGDPFPSDRLERWRTVFASTEERLPLATAIAREAGGTWTQRAP